MPKPDTFTIEKEKLQLGQIIKRCESLARLGQGVFVGREAIRARLRRGVRKWSDLVCPIKSHRERVKEHPWRSQEKTNGEAGKATQAPLTGFTAHARPYDGHDPYLLPVDYPEFESLALAEDDG